jgi:hypothetical protein
VIFLNPDFRISAPHQLDSEMLNRLTILSVSVCEARVRSSWRSKFSFALAMKSVY